VRGGGQTFSHLRNPSSLFFKRRYVICSCSAYSINKKGHYGQPKKAVFGTRKGHLMSVWYPQFLDLSRATAKAHTFKKNTYFLQWSFFGLFEER
jgi:hypothetical protein